MLAKKPIVTDTVHVNRRVHFEQISEVLDIPIDEIRALNPQYIADIIPGNIHPYTLTLPSVQAACYVANEDSIVNHNADKYARPDRITPGATVKGTSSQGGEYVETLVVKYHTVKKGENLNTIAKRYGVSASEIRKTNKIKGSRLKKGTKLKINTYERQYIQPQAPADSTIAATVSADSISTAQPEIVEQPKPAKKAETTPARSTAPQTKNYTVKKGDTLSKIATKNGVTIDALRKANNLKNDNIQVGQRLKIPVKGSYSSSSKSASKKKSTRKSKKRRR